MLKRDIGEPLVISALVETSPEKSVVYLMENGEIVSKKTEYADGAIIVKRRNETAGIFTDKVIQLAIRAAGDAGGWGEAVTIHERVPRLEGASK